MIIIILLDLNQFLLIKQTNPTTLIPTKGDKSIPLEITLKKYCSIPAWCDSITQAILYTHIQYIKKDATNISHEFLFSIIKLYYSVLNNRRNQPHNLFILTIIKDSLYFIFFLGFSINRRVFIESNPSFFIILNTQSL